MPFQKILLITYFWATISKTSTFKIRGFRYSFVDLEIFLIFIPRISHEQLSPKTITIPFSARTICHVYLNILPKLWQTFRCYQQKIQKISDFWYFKDHRYGSKHDSKTNEPMFLIYSLWSIYWYVSFQDFQNSIPWTHLLH